VLTTDQEHGGCLAVGLHWHAAGVVSSVKTVAVPYGVNATVGSASRTPLVFASHVLTTTGLHLPLKQVAALIHKHGALFVVDGAQAPRWDRGAPWRSCGAGVHTVPAHKWLFAPTSSGLLYVRNSSAQALVTSTLPRRRLLRLLCLHRHHTPASHHRR